MLSVSPGSFAYLAVCAKRRRAAACTNDTKLPIAAFDEAILSTLEGDALSPAAIEGYLATVDTGGADEIESLIADRDRLRGEVKRLVDSVAEGVVPKTTARDGIATREAEIERLEARLRAPRPKAPDVETLRKDLTLTAKGWKKTLRSEPKVARMLVRRLVGPITAPRNEPLAR